MEYGDYWEKSFWKIGIFPKAFSQGHFPKGDLSSDNFWSGKSEVEKIYATLIYGTI